MLALHRHILTIIMIVLPLVAFSQKKEMSQAKDFIKTSKSLDKAESLMRSVISMPGHENDIEAHKMLTLAIRKQYEQVNEKLYLNQLKDTASLFPVMRRMFDAYEALDSVASRPDKKGKIDLSLRKRNAEYLSRIRPNLYGGGMFYSVKNNYKETFKCLDCYLECERQPLFNVFNYSENDTLRYKAAYMAVLAAASSKDHKSLLKYSKIALEAKKYAPDVLIKLYDSYTREKDTINAVACLQKGFDSYPETPFFFPRLMNYYMETNKLDTVTALVEEALSLEPGNLFYRMARNTLLLNTGRYDECIALGDSLIHANDQMATVYFNVGSAYYNQALEATKSSGTIKQKRERSAALYRKSRPYLERYRTLRPKRQDHWAPMLYNIYLNLNLGAEFDEIEKLLKG